MKKIAVSLWFENQAEQAAALYNDVFNAKVGDKAKYTEAGSEVSGQPKGSVMSVDVNIDGLQIVGINGGPIFKSNPTGSLFVSCTGEGEIEEKWKKLSEGGQVRMGLDKYPWAEAYGWTTDKYGVEWQLISTPSQRKVCPAFLFVDSLFGKGEEALKLYTSIIPNSKIDHISKDDKTNTIAHARFSLNGDSFVLMEGGGKHGHVPNEAFSLMVFCDTQEEIDMYWDKFISNGGKESQCGWLKDKFGFSWQITPSEMGKLMSNPEKAQKVFSEMVKMKKIDLAKLRAAAQS